MSGAFPASPLAPELVRDIHALADCLLDDDPETAQEVRDRIARIPEAEAAYRAYRAQNEALRRAYSARLPDVVPERLRMALYAPRRRHSGTWKAAAMILVVTSAGVAGWTTGRQGETLKKQTAIEFARSASEIYADASAGRDDPADGTVGQEVAWTADRLSISLQAPNLREHGYFLIGSDRVDIAGSSGVRLRYAESGSGEEVFSLFLRPRWEERSAGVRISRDHDISIATWLDGPFAVAVTGRLRQARLNALAENVREAMQERDAVHPLVEPEPERRHEALLSPDAAGDGRAETRPALPARGEKAQILSVN